MPAGVAAPSRPFSCTAGRAHFRRHPEQPAAAAYSVFLSEGRCGRSRRIPNGHADIHDRLLKVSALVMRWKRWAWDWVIR